MCTHLSAFGGNIFVAPNPIDFEKVWTEFERLGDTGNILVLSTVCAVFGIYIVGLVFARRADNKDLQKVSIILMPIEFEWNWVLSSVPVRMCWTATLIGYLLNLTDILHR